MSRSSHEGEKEEWDLQGWAAEGRCNPGRGGSCKDAGLTYIKSSPVSINSKCLRCPKLPPQPKELFLQHWPLNGTLGKGRVG